MKKISPTVGAARNGCLVYEQQGQNVVVLVDTPSWYAWLETATTFTFICEEGTFTAHKARAGNRRGGWYWRAYRRQRGRLSRCYLGVSSNLTLANLCEVARRLAADGESTGSSQTGEDTPPLVSVPLAFQRLTPTVILQSSITPPRLPVQHVARPRLLALLEQGLRGPVTLVSAPAGSGKTTLLADGQPRRRDRWPGFPAKRGKTTRRACFPHSSLLWRASMRARTAWLSPSGPGIPPSMNGS